MNEWILALTIIEWILALTIIMWIGLVVITTYKKGFDDAKKQMLNHIEDYENKHTNQVKNK